MTYDKHLISLPWDDYELLDSGDNMKLERFGDIVLVRPETQALWKKRAPELWNNAHAVFAFQNGKGSWKKKKSFSEPWTVSWNDMRLYARLAGFKHTGIFPEQAKNWSWISEKCSARENMQVLNLFGYTGVATLVAARAGAFVTHVDASKQSLDWAHENARLSEVPEKSVRWIFDDALAFVRREVRRGACYDGIILDPPSFGRGAKGEVWRIEESLPKLLEALTKLLSETSGSFLLINGYAAGYSPRSFAQAVESAFDAVAGESGELSIKETGSERVIPAGIYVRFSR